MHEYRGLVIKHGINNGKGGTNEQNIQINIYQ